MKWKSNNQNFKKTRFILHHELGHHSRRDRSGPAPEISEGLHIYRNYISLLLTQYEAHLWQSNNNTAICTSKVILKHFSIFIQTL